MLRGLIVTSRSLRVLAVALFGVGIAGLVLTGAMSSNSASGQTRTDRETLAVQQAHALTRQPKLFDTADDGALTARAVPGAAAAHYDASTVETGAKRIAADIPFPPGLNSASHLNWAGVLDRGLGGTVISDSELRRIVQANALRDWAWWSANRPLSADQRTVVNSIPDWSAFRGQAGDTPTLAQQAMELGRNAEGRAFAARFFIESGGAPRPSRW